MPCARCGSCLDRLLISGFLLFIVFFFCYGDIAECMDLLEEMERQQKGLSEENAVLRTENESYLAEISRLSAILAAREQVCRLLRALKHV